MVEFLIRRTILAALIGSTNTPSVALKLVISIDQTGTGILRDPVLQGGVAGFVFFVEFDFFGAGDTRSIADARS